jgi:hypothetical protein
LGIIARLHAKLHDQDNQAREALEPENMAARNSIGMPKPDLARSLGPGLNLALEGVESAKAGRSNVSALLFPCSG